MDVVQHYEFDPEQGDIYKSQIGPTSIVWFVKERLQTSGNVAYVHFKKDFEGKSKIKTGEIFFAGGDPEKPYSRERPPTIEELAGFVSKVKAESLGDNTTLEVRQYVHEQVDSILRALGTAATA